MNTQEVITPVAKFIEWTFETVLVPISSPFNMSVIALGFVGLFFLAAVAEEIHGGSRAGGRNRLIRVSLDHAKSSTSAPMSFRQ